MSITKSDFITILQKSNRIDPFFVSTQHHISQHFGTKEHLIQAIARDVFDIPYTHQVGTIYKLSLLLKELPIKHFGKEFKNIVQTTQYLWDIPTLEAENSNKTIAELSDVFFQNIDRDESNIVAKNEQEISSSRFQKVYNKIQSIVSGYRELNPMMRKFVVKFLRDCIFINKEIQAIISENEQDRITKTEIVMRNWMRKLLPWFDIAVTYSGLGNIPQWLFTLVSNHESSFDTIALMNWDLSANVFLATDVFASIPLFGPIYKSATILANLDSDASKWKAFVKMKQLPDQWIIPWFFPEWERNTTDEVLLPFDIGAFLLSIEQNLPILPTCITWTREICPVWEKELYPGNIHVAYLNSVSLDEQEFTILRQLESNLSIQNTKEVRWEIKKEQMRLAQILSAKVRNTMLDYLSSQKSLDK